MVRTAVAVAALLVAVVCGACGNNSKVVDQQTGTQQSSAPSATAKAKATSAPIHTTPRPTPTHAATMTSHTSTTTKKPATPTPYHYPQSTPSGPGKPTVPGPPGY